MVSSLMAISLPAHGRDKGYASLGAMSIDRTLCATCAVETDPVHHPELCPICADERQWVPRDGQRWTSVTALIADGHRVSTSSPEPGLLSLTTEPGVGIGQTGQLVSTDQGSLLWDPPGLISDEALVEVSQHGRVLAIAASHPHMFGVQTAWAEALDAPVLVNADDADWVQLRQPRIEVWRGFRELAPGLVLYQLGGHFKGSSVVHWAAGADGRGVVLAGDTVFVNPDGTASFMRSYPNRIPLSGAVVLRLAATLDGFAYDRLYNNFGSVIPADAKRIVRFSAERHAAWTRGDHDDLT